MNLWEGNFFVLLLSFLMFQKECRECKEMEYLILEFLKLMFYTFTTIFLTRLEIICASHFTLETEIMYSSLYIIFLFKIKGNNYVFTLHLNFLTRSKISNTIYSNYPSSSFLQKRF